VITVTNVGSKNVRKMWCLHEQYMKVIFCHVLRISLTFQICLESTAPGKRVNNQP
jgi:hypothetical protein